MSQRTRSEKICRTTTRKTQRIAKQFVPDHHTRYLCGGGRHAALAIVPTKVSKQFSKLMPEKRVCSSHRDTLHRTRVCLLAACTVNLSAFSLSKHSALSKWALQVFPDRAEARKHAAAVLSAASGLRKQPLTRLSWCAL